MSSYEMQPIGWVASPRFGREDEYWGAVGSTIRLDAERFDAEALVGVDAFSHVEVIFLFDRFDEAKVTVGSRQVMEVEGIELASFNRSGSPN